MALSRKESEELIEELQNKLEEAEFELEKRPTKTVEIETVKEVVITNSEIGGDLGLLGKALALAQKELKAVGKDSEAHKYNFSSFQNVVESSLPILSKHGLSITQLTLTKTIGKTVFSGVRTMLVHEDGGYISGEAYVPTAKTKMNTLIQMFGVNTSYLKRYGWLAICGLSTTDDDTDTDGVG